MPTLFVTRRSRSVFAWNTLNRLRGDMFVFCTISLESQVLDKGFCLASKSSKCVHKFWSVVKSFVLEMLLVAIILVIISLLKKTESAWIFLIVVYIFCNSYKINLVYCMMFFLFIYILFGAKVVLELRYSRNRSNERSIACDTQE